MCLACPQPETFALPSACERFTRLLKQAAALRAQDHPIGIQLAVEVEKSGHFILSQVLLQGPLALITVPSMVEMCAELLAAVPPGEEWLRVTLDSQNAQFAAINEGHEPKEEALQKAMSTAGLLLQQAVQRLAQQQAEAAMPEQEQPPAEGAAADEVEVVAEAAPESQ